MNPTQANYVCWYLKENDPLGQKEKNLEEKVIYKTSGQILVSQPQSVQVMLDNQLFNQKPDQPQTKGISKSLETASAEIFISDLAGRVGRQGCSFVPALLDGLGRKAENWVHQQVFGLDFDATITLHEFELKKHGTWNTTSICLQNIQLHGGRTEISGSVHSGPYRYRYQTSRSGN
jgi:hypothetical protein